MERCFDIQQIANLAELPTEDPRRRHLDDCPQCRGLAEAHALFLEPGDVPDLEDLTGADAELQDRLAAALEKPPVVVRSPRKRRLWLAVAAVLAVVAVGLTADELLRMRAGSDPQVGQRLRGEDQMSGLTVTAGDDVLRFAWPEAPAADTYLFVYLDADLNEVGRRTAAQSWLDLPSPELPLQARFCQAFAVSLGDTVARSLIVATRPARE